MKIRDLKWKGLPMWPPEWVSDLQLGEKGILVNVEFRPKISEGLIFIEAVHSGEYRKGIVMIEDLAHLEIVFEKLRENLGRPLTEIGDLEIDFASALQKYGLKQARLTSTTKSINRVVKTK